MLEYLIHAGITVIAIVVVAVMFQPKEDKAKLLERIKGALPHEEAVYFPPPTKEEQEAWEKKNTPTGELLAHLSKLHPWKSTPPTSPSSGSSKSTE